MKALKIFSVAYCMAAVCLTSCIGDDSSEVKNLTQGEIATCLNAVRGTHLGKVYYSAPTQKDVNNVDSVDISWTISTDSTMTIHDFPARLLAHNIDSVSTQGKELRAALQACPDQDIDCYIGFMKISPIYWLITPRLQNIPLSSTMASTRYRWLSILPTPIQAVSITPALRSSRWRLSRVPSIWTISLPHILARTHHLFFIATNNKW